MADAREQATGLAEEIAARLCEQVASGALRPGQRLFETKFATEMEISRNTLREAFRLLTRDGVLRYEPNRGVFVAVPSMASVLDIYRARRLIEVPALAQAWPRHEAVARMRLAVDHAERMASVLDWRAVGSANIEFHRAIVALTDSPRLIAFFARLSVELRLAFGLLKCPAVLHEPYISLNRAIVQRIEDGDPKCAADLLEDYLAKSERMIMASFARLD